MRERIGETADWGDATPWVGWRSSLLQPPTRSFPDAQDENRKKPRVEAAAGVEAQNAPTPAWKTHRTGFPQLPHALSSVCQSEGVSFSVVWESKDPVA
jgi:hypothetical protein